MYDPYSDFAGSLSRDRRQNTPVVLSRIYTRTGDDGTTALGDGSRAAKTDPRLAAYSDVDEANCAIGAAVTMGGLPADVTGLLLRLQNELFDLGADLCNPLSPAAGPPPYPPLRIDEGYVTRLGQACDRFNASRQEPAWYFNKVPEPKRAKNRVHLDLVNPDPAAVDELVRLGATVTGKHQIPGQCWTVMQDPEGNEFCIAAKSFTG
jgi:Cobalamin adenosyltransferase/Glyoxalase-like domain